MRGDSTRLIVAVSALAMLAGCNSAAREAEAAERQYQMVVSGDAGDWDQRCAAAKRVADAWLRAEDRQKWDLASSQAALDCNHALMVRNGL